MTGFKVLLICGVIIALFMSVMIYQETQVAPPQMLEERNDDAVRVVEEAVSGDWPAGDLGELQKRYYVVRDLMMRMQRDRIMEIGSTREEALYGQYGARVVALYRSMVGDKYKSSSLRAFYPYAKELKGMEGLDGRRLAERVSSVNAGISQLLNLHDRLNKGWRLVSQHFDGLDGAKQLISKGKALRADEELSHCADLMAAVASQPNRLNDEHYDYLWKQVARLGRYGQYNRSESGIQEYNALLELVNERLEEYSSNAHSVYGQEYDLEDLVEERDRYVEEAERYFYDRRYSY